ncbi:hypothetical protein DH86_00002618, partial [Scytalidium sp. 3C]
FSIRPFPSTLRAFFIRGRPAFKHRLPYPPPYLSTPAQSVSVSKGLDKGARTSVAWAERDGNARIGNSDPITSWPAKSWCGNLPYGPMFHQNSSVQSCYDEQRMDLDQNVVRVRKAPTILP